MTTKRIVVGAHYGQRDWLAQRFTAATMAAYTLVLLGWLVALPELTYGSWAGMFASADTIVLGDQGPRLWVCIARDVGRVISIDYIKPTALRLALQVITIVLLLGYACWAVIILWSV